MPYISRAARKAALEMAWSELLEHVRNAERCGEREARRQIDLAVEDRALRWHWEDERTIPGGTGAAFVPDGEIAFPPANYWQTCEIDSGDPDRVFEPLPYDRKFVNKRRAARLDKGRRFRKPLFERECVFKIWPVPPSTVGNLANEVSGQARAPTAGQGGFGEIGLSERYPGRPSVKPAILRTFCQRAASGITLGTLAAEARWLLDWAHQVFPGEPGLPSKPQVVENQIREQYNSLKRKPPPIK
jgi:hypothetical protein